MSYMYSINENKNSANWCKFKTGYVNKTVHGFPSIAFHYSLLTYLYIILSLSTWKAGEYAKEKNITISILAVEGARTGLEMVSKCAEISGGTINVLNPLEISRQLRLISQNYIIATYVTITLFLHPELEVDDPRFPKVC